MATPGGAFSAALRRSQDLDILEQKHDTLTGQVEAHGPTDTYLHPTCNKLVHLENNGLARRRSRVYFSY